MEGVGGVNVLSLFDGMSCGQISLNRIGIKPTKYYASELDKHAIKVTQANYPNTVQLGDVTQWREWDINWDSIDLLIGGSPCQGFSFAGKQLAFDDPRSKLFFVYVDILNHIKSVNPSVKFMLENVKMKKEFLAVISEHLGVEPVFINSALVSAQNRQRYYWCNWNVEQPEDRGIAWGDVREHGVSEYYYTEKGLQWLARHSQRKNKPLDVWGENEKAQMVEASHYKNYSSQRFFGVCDLPNDKECIAAMRGRCLVDGKRNDEAQKAKGNTAQFVEFRYDGKSNAITTVTKDNIVVPFTLPNRIPIDLFFFRYITPIECERLQTVPDNYTNHVSNTQRYKMLGNGWTVDVIAHIFSQMQVPISLLSRQLDLFGEAA
jgi:DNA-cytosine methyltransferase